jgi:hypothetical protein
MKNFAWLQFLSGCGQNMTGAEDSPRAKLGKHSGSKPIHSFTAQILGINISPQAAHMMAPRLLPVSR